MAIPEPTAELGLWPAVRAITGWPEPDEDAVLALAEDWRSAGESFASVGRTDVGPLAASWSDAAGVAMSSRVRRHLDVAVGVAGEMAGLQARAAQFAQEVTSVKRGIHDVINANLKPYGVASMLPPGVRDAAQGWLVSHVAGVINDAVAGAAERVAGPVGGARSATASGFQGPGPGEEVSPELAAIRDAAARLDGGHVTIPWYQAWETDDTYRAEWIRDNRAVIAAAAARYGLPPDLVAGIAWQEVGGEAYWTDNAVYDARRARDAVTGADPNADGGANATSLGPIAIQVRRAAETLGYDPATLTTAQTDQIVQSLNDPKQNIYIAAAHLADLRQEGNLGSPGQPLTPDQYRELATRYNGGPYWQSQDAQGYGDSFVGNLPDARRALG